LLHMATPRPTRVRPWPAALRATRFSLGTPEPLDPADLDALLRAVRAVDPVWIAVYLGCRHRPEIEVCYPQPVDRTRAVLGRAVAKCRELADACGRPVLVENVAAFGSSDGSVPHAEFVNRLCAESGCGFLADVSALALDSRLGFDPRRWLWAIDPSHVSAIHVGVGGTRWREADHPDEAWGLARDLAEQTPVGTAILRWDGGAQRTPSLRATLRQLALLDRASAPARGYTQPAFATVS
jgi:uncharacterized protein (UPF0276 family)